VRSEKEVIGHSYRNSMNILSICFIHMHTLDLSAEYTLVVSLSSIDNHSTARRCVKRCIPFYEVSLLGELWRSELTMTIMDNEMYWSWFMSYDTVPIRNHIRSSDECSTINILTCFTQMRGSLVCHTNASIDRARSHLCHSKTFTFIRLISCNRSNVWKRHTISSNVIAN
jgi:hypothetical protein